MPGASLQTLVLHTSTCDHLGVPMKLKRWTFRDADTRDQFYRQLSVGLITGEIIGMSFMPTKQLHYGIVPICAGVILGLTGLLHSPEDKS